MFHKSKYGLTPLDTEQVKHTVYQYSTVLLKINEIIILNKININMITGYRTKSKSKDKHT
jgi:hypothetical protein